MEFQKRVNDVEKVFDKCWQANHNRENVKQYSEDRKKHFQKMYNIKDKEEHKKEVLEFHSVNGRVKRLEDNMNAANAANKLDKMNSFRNNFR